MSIESRLYNLEQTVANLQESFIQSQRNNSQIVSKTDDTSNKVEQITPTTYTKTAYIGDTEVVFTDVPSGNLTVYVTDSEGNIPNYTVTKAEYIKVAFDTPLENVATVTISIV